MSALSELTQRSNNLCELCGAENPSAVFAVAPNSDDNDAEQCIAVCGNCESNLQKNPLDANDWRCLNDTMWSQVPAVQVVIWRLLNQLSSETWAQGALDMMYLDDDTAAWANSGSGEESDEPTLDSNGTVLQAGDTVTLIKDLPVKGAGFTAKRGTAVRGISLTNNPTQIEGRVNGVRIVLLTQYLKKA